MDLNKVTYFEKKNKRVVIIGNISIFSIMITDVSMNLLMYFLDILCLLIITTKISSGRKS